MENNIAIKVEHLSKVYKIFDKPFDRVKESLNPFGKRYSKDFYALNDVSFEIKKGETIGIIGKNGAGKSTLLKMITGVLTPTSGSLQVNGRIASLLELGAGFNPEMTGIENIYMNGSIMGYGKDEMDEKLDNIIAFADIGDFIYQPVKMYSSGMFTRLAFAVNAYVEPDILIVDEALSVGDVAFQAKCITRMKQMMDSGVTILFVTHDMSVIKSFCKRCVYLQNGVVKMSGNSAEVADFYLREVREQMMLVNAKECNKEKFEMFNSMKRKRDFCFKVDKSFAERVDLFRQGNGKVRIQACEVLDSSGNPILEAEFDQKIILRIYIEFYDNVEVGVGYHIRDDKNIELLGSSLKIESGQLLFGTKGERYVVEFVTRVPLCEGMYNFTLVVSTPTDLKSTGAIFSDLIENAYLLKVREREKGKLWNKVYLPVECTVSVFEKGEEEKGRRKKCACCGAENINFNPLPEYYENERKKYGCTNVSRPEMVNINEYSCPYCGAADRERAYALWMRKEIAYDSHIKILDIAPARPLGDFITKNYPNAIYKTADLFMEGVDYKLDIMNMHQIQDNSIDFFICSHVLEHVRDDLKAMSELKRILSVNGRGILVVPMDLNQKEIDEDPNCTDIGERWRRFGQDDHIRKYSRQGYIERLKMAGFSVKEYGVEYFGETLAFQNSLLDTSTVYIVSKNNKKID